MLIPFLYFCSALTALIKSFQCGARGSLSINRLDKEGDSKSYPLFTPLIPPTGLVLHGFPFNPTVVRLYKVELRVSRS